MASPFRYLRFVVFQKLKKPFSGWTRKRRMGLFARTMGLSAGTRIVDLGGLPEIWETVPGPLDITILNLAEALPKRSNSRHAVTYVVGDGCKVSAYSDKSFDLVFSNSVIEHVGDRTKRLAFAQEVSRLGYSFWVQTPSIWFPIEAHNGMPFWWFYPQSLRTAILKRWSHKLPAWTQMVRETDIVTRAELKELFPKAEIVVERVFGIPKSYVAFHRGSSPALRRVAYEAQSEGNSGVLVQVGRLPGEYDPGPIEEQYHVKSQKRFN